MNKIIEMAKEAREAREASFDIAVETLMIHAEAIGYKTEEPEECVRWELAKAFYEEFKKGDRSMNKRIRRALVLCKALKLCRELQSENKGLKNSLEEARNEIKQRNSLLTFLEERLREKASMEVPYSTMYFIIPNLYLMEATLKPTTLDSRPQAEYMTRKLTDEMKIKLFNDLFEQGYIRKTRDTKDGEVYEIKVVR